MRYRLPKPQRLDDEEQDDSNGSDSGSEDDLVFPDLVASLAKSLGAALKAKAQEHGRAASPEPAQKVKRSQQDQPGAVQELHWQPEVAPPKSCKPHPSNKPVAADKEPDLAKKLLAPPRITSVPKEPKQAKDASAGKQWYNLPATEITDDVKRELRLLRLRAAYDPKRFYKSLDDTKFPKHFHIGTVVDAPTDYFSGRLTQRERGTTITQELLQDEGVTRARKKRYGRLMEEATRYQKVKKRKTDMPRLNKKPQRPKH